MEADKPSMFLPATDASCARPPARPVASRTMKNRRRVNRKQRRTTRRN